jgi:uncharacterized surface protein with fasciclin (FAS1) repeats
MMAIYSFWFLIATSLPACYESFSILTTTSRIAVQQPFRPLQRGLQTTTTALNDTSNNNNDTDDAATTASTADTTNSAAVATTPVSDLEAFVAKEFPAFYALLSLNEALWQIISESDNGYTLFAPSDRVFDSLGEKKLQQLKDARNLEAVQKMGLYHIVNDETVSSAQLRTEDWTQPAPKDGSPRPITVQALVTLGGEVPVGRSKSGGFFLFGIGAKEDGNVVIGPEARIVKSYKVDGSIVHEVDALISPVILWRYMDQLRIPGF